MILINSKDFDLKINERRLQIVINETIQKKLECSLQDMVVIGRKYDSKQKIFVELRPDLFEQLYMLKDLDYKWKNPLSISRCTPYTKPFFPQGFKIGDY